MSTPAWPDLLRRLRAGLSVRRDGGKVVGSLRWLEDELGRRGGNSAALRNIVYRDIGTPEDKRLLQEIISDLELEAGFGSGRAAVDAAKPPAEDSSHLSLGKRRLYRRFLAGVRRQKPVRMLVVAPPGAGKTILVDALSQALPGSLRLRLEGDLAPDLERLAARMGLEPSLVTRTLGALDERAAYAVNGALQQELSRALVLGISQFTHPLLIRVGENSTLGGHPLRLPTGEACSAAAWVWYHLLAPLAQQGPALFVALSSADGLPSESSGELGEYREVLPLPSPSLEDARKFVRAKLPYLPPADVERIVRQAGRDYDALGLLTLLSAVTENIEPDAPLPPVRDTALRDFLLVLEVCFSPEFPDAELSFLEALLGGPLSERRDLERAFLEVTGQLVRPTRPELPGRLLAPLNLRKPAALLHRHALQLALEAGNSARALHHALYGEAWDILPQLQTSGTALDLAWKTAQAVGYPAEVTEHLARLLVAEYALRGQYHHPEMLAALETLGNSNDENVRAWAAVKQAEALVNDAQYAEARQLLDSSGAGSDPVTQAEHALSRAAVTRWEGRPEQAYALLDEAESFAAMASVDQAPGLQVKIRLWRSLCTKDLGDWQQALPLLEQMMQEPGASPLQRARAAYQLGDALMRLGQQSLALQSLEVAVQGLETHRAGPDEQSRVMARLATVLRRLGRLSEAQQMIERAIALDTDTFTHARALSEAVPLYAAQGDLQPALLAGRQAWATFSEAESVRPSEARYRRLRVEYRVALAYLARGLQVPYLPPMGGAQIDHPDLVHARTLLLSVQGSLPDNQADRLASLRVDVSLALAVASPEPMQAQAHARAAVAAAVHAYQQAQARIGLVEALLRGGQHAAALLEVGRAYRAARQAAQLTGHTEWDEPGLQAWLVLLEFGASLSDDLSAAWSQLQLALQDQRLRPFHGALAAQAGAMLTAAGQDDLAAELTADPLLAASDAARYRFRVAE